MDGIGEWLYDEAKIKDHIQLGFSKLYTTKMYMAQMDSPVAKFSCCFLSEEERGWMGREVDDVEIKDALWTLKPFKAPGPMVCMPGFFSTFGKM